MQSPRVGIPCGVRPCRRVQHRHHSAQGLLLLLGWACGAFQGRELPRKFSAVYGLAEEQLAAERVECGGDGTGTHTELMSF